MKTLILGPAGLSVRLIEGVRLIGGPLKVAEPVLARASHLSDDAMHRARNKHGADTALILFRSL